MKSKGRAPSLTDKWTRALRKRSLKSTEKKEVKNTESKEKVTNDVKREARKRAEGRNEN